jgi:hypothetical protein
MLPLSNRVPVSVKASPTLPSTSQRQGWAWKTHDVMNKALVQIIPNANLELFLAQYMKHLEIGNRFADGKKVASEIVTDLHLPNISISYADKYNPSRFYLRNGSHYINLEEVMEKYDLKDSSQIRPAMLATAPKPQNIFNTVFEYYGKVLHQLRHIKKAEDKKGFSSKEALDELAFLMGILSHFTTDAFQPLHTTKDHTETLKFKLDLHKLVENVMSDFQNDLFIQDFKIDAENRKKAVLTLSALELRNLFAEHISKSFKEVRRVYAIVDKAEDKAVKSEDRSPFLNYYQFLHGELTSHSYIPSYMKEATIYTATMLYSLYNKAGKPHLLGKDLLNRASLQKLTTKHPNLETPF